MKNEQAVNTLLEICESQGGESMNIRLNVNGCDDSTCFDIDVTESELEFLEKIVEKCNSTSTYGCMPTMDIEVPDKS